MKYLIEIDIKEIVSEDMPFLKQKQLLEYILFDCTNALEFNEIIESVLNDMLQAEMEFDNRENVIEAYKTLIKTRQ